MGQFRGAVIGLGQIGMGYDFESDSRSVLTHAQAYSLHPDFSLTAGVDPDPGKRALFEKKFGAPSFPTSEEMMNACEVNVVSICTGTDSHFSICEKLIAQKPRAIICEKPICYSVKEAETLMAVATAANVPILVNYMRRFEPGTLGVKNILQKGTLGALQGGTVMYSKGVFNNASHFIDLLAFWAGPVRLKSVLAKRRSLGLRDFDADFILNVEGAEIHFQALKEECYSVADLRLYGEKGMLAYSDGGVKIEIAFAKEDPSFPGYQALEPLRRLEGDMLRYQLHVLEKLSAFLSGRENALNSTLESATDTLRIVEQIERGIASPGVK